MHFINECRICQSNNQRGSWPGDTESTGIEARDYLASMQRGFCISGGLLTGDAVAVLLARVSPQPISALAHWVVQRQIVSFRSNGQIWIPMFQFEPVGMQPYVSAMQVVSELSAVFDDTELAAWFATPNLWLAGQLPANALAAIPEEVLGAARADRFVAAG